MSDEHQRQPVKLSGGGKILIAVGLVILCILIIVLTPENFFERYQLL